MFSLKQVIEFLTKLSASIETTESLSDEHEDIVGRLHNLETEASRLRMRVIDLENNKSDEHGEDDALVTRKWVKDYVEREIDGADYVDSYDVMDKIHDAVQEMDVDDHISDGLRNFDFSSDIEDAVSNYDFTDEIDNVLISAVNDSISGGQGHDLILDMVRDSIKDSRIEIHPG